jgi:hypothetical protein
MIGYVTLGANDLPRATFYDRIAEAIGVTRMMAPRPGSWQP